MKIAVNTRFLLKGKIEGMGLFTHEVLKRLVEQHPEDGFIFFFDRSYDSSYIYGKNVKPVVLFPPARHPFLFIWWFESSVAKALKKYQPDVFLSPDNFLTLNTCTKTVLVTHDIAHVHFPAQVSFFQRKYYQLLVSKFNKKADRIVTVSHFTKKDLIREYGIEEEKISVACNGCQEDFKPFGFQAIENIRKEYSDGKPYFFYIGAIHPRKNIHRLIAAFDQFKKETDSPVKLLLAGRFAWKSDEVKDTYDKSPNQPDIHFLGYVDDEMLVRLMGGALACTYVSLFEGFGIPILQAMHAEIPVITSNVSSMPEVAGKAALSIDPYSVEEISQAMQQIWRDAHLRSRLVAEGRIQREKFTWQKAADVIYQNLKAAIS